MPERIDMLHKRYPEASARAMEVVHAAMTDGFVIESEGYRKADGKRFVYSEIPFLMNWGRP